MGKKMENMAYVSFYLIFIWYWFFFLYAILRMVLRGMMMITFLSILSAFFSHFTPSQHVFFTLSHSLKYHEQFIRAPTPPEMQI